VLKIIEEEKMKEIKRDNKKRDNKIN